MFSANEAIRGMVDTLQYLGVNLNKQNILLTTANYSTGNRNLFGIHENQKGQSIVLLRPNARSIETYLKQEVVQALYNNYDKQQQEEFDGFISSVISQIETLDIPRTKNVLKQIQRSSNPTNTFIKYFYGSSSFNHAIREANLSQTIYTAFNSLLDNRWEVSYTDPLVREFDSKIKDNKISLTDLEEYQRQLGTGSPVETIQEINNRITDGRFFDIKFIGAKEILFRKTTKQPQFIFDIVNTEYYGELVEPVATLSGYNIVKYNDRYYVSDKIITNTEDLSGTGSATLNMAQGLIKYKLQNDRLSVTDIRQKVKYGNKAIESRSKKYKIGDRFVALDVKLQEADLLQGDKKLSSMTYNQFLNELKTSPLWSKVVWNLDADINTVLNTPEKAETFILLRAQLRDMTEYKKIYTNKNPRIDTSEKIKFETDLTSKVLDIIKNAKEVVYEIIEKNGNKYLIEPVKVNDNVSVYTQKQKSFKSELLTIAEYLDKNFGVKTNIVTTSDIARDFKKIIPNAGRVNAFIFNNEIYINIDKATTADSLHEFAHIVMGTIKRNSPKLYYGLLQKIEELPDYNLRLSRFTEDKRARTDLNEEIFVDTFGEFFARVSNPWFNDKTLDMKELGEKFKQGTQKMLQTGKDINSETVGRLLNMSVNEIMTEFGSTLAEKDPSMFDMDIAHESRVTSNLIKTLMESGKLIENCE